MGEYTVQIETNAISRPRGGAARAVALFLEETRPCVQVVFLMRFLAGAALAAGGRSAGLGPWVVVPAASWALAALFAYGINGVSDVAEDRVNRTGRPIARGELSRRAAARLTWLSAAGSVALAVLSRDVLLLGYVLGFLLLGYAYSAGPFTLKRSAAGTSGTVLAMGLLTYAAGWTAAGAARPTGPGLVLAVGMSLWMCVVGAVTKDFSHARGDAAAGRRTSVTAWGDLAARRVGAVGALAVAAGFAAAAGPWPVLLGPAALVLLGGAVAVAVLCAATRPDAAPGRTPYRAFMVTQHLAHGVLFAGLVLL
ncbi:UbiA family prenyltransferase [Streptomyces sp. B1866]|uniref:UbiA family prenyltransferase n=1 Tax=Streptomyces sp. B1866 TaxID=3075431 RepID=UPI00288DAF90|nr:UbiA family prenyltransferase [Streptomyces sp. B1866]MDT3398054.1 UbiA family prenyltransferase [Streptomyces sp. B1866]